MLGAPSRSHGFRPSGFGLTALLAIAVVGCGSHDTPTAPSIVLPAAAGRFPVTLPGAGVTLGGVLFRPEIPQGTRPGIIVLHGWQPAGSDGSATVEPRARRYSEEGNVALALSMRGWPPSGGTDDCGLQQPDDVLRAVSWLAAQSGVDAQRNGDRGLFTRRTGGVARRRPQRAREGDRVRLPINSSRLA